MALPLQGEVVDEWWIDLLLGDCLGVDHVDDEVSHESLALWPLSNGNATWVVRSPDGDEWAEDLSCIDPNFGPSQAWPFPRVGLRPRGRRRLHAFLARLVDEPLRDATLRAREQVIQMGGDGAYRPMRVVRSDGSVRSTQSTELTKLDSGSVSGGCAPCHVLSKRWTSETLSRGRTPALPRMMTTKMLETAKMQTRKGVEGVSSRRQVDDSSGRGKTCCHNPMKEVQRYAGNEVKR